MADTTQAQQVFLKLFLKYENNLRAFVRSLVPTLDDVDEVIQEASITMMNKFDDLRDEEGFLPWAIVISRYTTLNYLRKRRRDRHVFDDELLELLSDEGLDSETTDTKESLGALKQCLSKLDQTQQTLVLAPYLENNSLTMIAENKGVSVNSLYKKVGRLRDKLGKCVQQTALQYLSQGANA